MTDSLLNGYTPGTDRRKPDPELHQRAHTSLDSTEFGFTLYMRKDSEESAEFFEFLNLVVEPTISRQNRSIRAQFACRGWWFRTV